MAMLTSAGASLPSCSPHSVRYGSANTGRSGPRSCSPNTERERRLTGERGCACVEVPNREMVACQKVAKFIGKRVILNYVFLRVSLLEQP